MAYPLPTAFPTPYSATTTLLQGDGTGYVILATCTGTIPVDAGVFQHGCLMYKTDTSTGSGALYQNIGSVAVPSWSLLDTASSSFTLPVAATDSTSTTTTSFALTQNAITTGIGTSISANGLTTGQGFKVASSATAITTTGRIFLSSHSGTTGTSAILNEFTSAATDETIIAQVTASAALALGTAFKVSSASTTGTAVAIASTAATTGGSLTVTDSSTDTGTRSAVTIAVSAGAATGATPLTITNANSGNPLIAGTATVQSTHFYKFATVNGVTLWIGDGTTANSALSGTAGDLLLNGGSNKPEYCTGTTNWTALV